MDKVQVWQNNAQPSIIEGGPVPNGCIVVAQFQFPANGACQLWPTQVAILLSDVMIGFRFEHRWEIDQRSSGTMQYWKYFMHQYNAWLIVQISAYFENAMVIIVF